MVTASSACEIPGCPALAEPLRATCGPHRLGRTAKELHIAKRWDGKGGESCIRCKRAFSETDWVTKERIKDPRKTKGDYRGYAHLTCEPKREPKPKGPQPTPLFEAVDA